MTKQQSKKLLVQTENSIALSNRELLKNVKITTDELNKELLNFFSKMPDETLANLNKYDRSTKVDIIVDSLIGTLTAATLLSITSNKRNTYKNSYKTMYSSLNLRDPKLAPKAIKNMLNNPFDGVPLKNRISNLRYNQVSKVKNIITQNLIKGSGIRGASSEIRTLLSKDFMYQADRIARTEVLRVMTEAQNQGFNEIKKKGFNIRKGWLTAGDGKVRDEHIDLDGLESDADGMFFIPILGYSIEGPRLSGDAKFDINCRCTTYTIIK